VTALLVVAALLAPDAGPPKLDAAQIAALDRAADRLAQRLEKRHRRRPSVRRVRQTVQGRGPFSLTLEAGASATRGPRADIGVPVATPDSSVVALLRPQRVTASPRVVVEVCRLRACEVRSWTWVRAPSGAMRTQGTARDLLGRGVGRVTVAVVVDGDRLEAPVVLRR